jgi:hypothetical protein
MELLLKNKTLLKINLEKNVIFDSLILILEEKLSENLRMAKEKMIPDFESNLKALSVWDC